MAVGVGTGVSALIEGRQGIQSLRDAVIVISFRSGHGLNLSA